MRKTILAAALCVVSSPAISQQAITNLNSPVPAGSSFGSIPGENSAGSTTDISSTTALDSNGSLHIAGDRTRVQTGVQYAPATTNLNVTADELVSFTGDYQVNNGGTGGIQSPAFRVYLNNIVWGSRGELIWEAAYNGGYTLGSPDSVGASDLFWMNVAGVGPTFVAGTQTYVMHTLSDWGDLLGPNWFVSAFGVGDGSGAGAGFDAYVDHLSLATSSPTFGTQTYDFQATPAVPEPATWAMMLVGFGGIGFQMRRSRKGSAPLTQAA